MYETFGNGGATTMKRKRERRPRWRRAARRSARVVSAAAAVQGSHVVDAQQHQLHADRRALRAAVRVVVPGRDVENFYRKSRNSVEAGQKEAPYGFVIPAGQKDMTRVAC